MRHRFETGSQKSPIRNYIVSIIVFLIIILCFRYFVSSVSTRTTAEEQQTLQAALDRSISHCYAIEGSYPESLEYLCENYGLTYNHDLFYIDYQPLGSDIMPDTTIIVKKGDKQ